MEKITLGEKNIESFGLVFEPNFFRIHCYGNVEGGPHVTTVDCKKGTSYDFSGLRGKNPLFGLTSSSYWTLVPTAVFREKDALRYLRLNTGFDEEKPIGFSTLEGLETVLVYQIDEKAEEIANTIQPGLELRHIVSILLEQARRKTSTAKNDLLSIFAYERTAIVTIFKEGRLLLANNIEIKKAEDLVYYVFYSLKKLGIDTIIPAEVNGSGAEFESVEKQIAKYLPNLAKPKMENFLAETIPACV